MLRHLRSAPLALLLPLAFACDSSSGTGSPWDDENFTVDAAEALGSYAQVVVASYADTITALPRRCSPTSGPSWAPPPRPA
jgi:hypothetical protein